MQPHLYSRAWYHAPNPEFLSVPADAVLGQLVRNSDFPVDELQRDAWVSQIDLLKSCLKGTEGTTLLEFSIPRMGKRVDAVLLVGPIVFVLEFKVGATTFDRSSIDQVWDYGLDLKNFHAASHDLPIVPVLVATGATSARLRLDLEKDDDNLYRPACVNAEALSTFIARARQAILGTAIRDSAWPEHRIDPRRQLWRRRGPSTVAIPLTRSRASMRVVTIYVLRRVESRSL